ncbi:MAG: winged helix-turn-helix domain-containing protein [Aeromicrobium sp.]
MASDLRPSVDLADVLTPTVTVRSLDTVVAQMREIVLSGRVRPGDRLQSERALARMLDVSRPTVREALRTMEATGPGDAGDQRWCPRSSA